MFRNPIHFLAFSLQIHGQRKQPIGPCEGMYFSRIQKVPRSKILTTTWKLCVSIETWRTVQHSKKKKGMCRPLSDSCATFGTLLVGQGLVRYGKGKIEIRFPVTLLFVVYCSLLARRGGNIKIASS